MNFIETKRFFFNIQGFTANKKYLKYYEYWLTFYFKKSTGAVSVTAQNCSLYYLAKINIQIYFKFYWEVSSIYGRNYCKLNFINQNYRFSKTNVYLMSF